MIREQIEQEARAAGKAAPQLRDDAVAAALAEAAAILRERRAAVLEANRADVEAAAGRLDEGMVDRLRLDEGRVEAMAGQVEATAALEPLEREIGSRTLPNGLVVSERRIPIGTVGANFEARPNVALDVAGQLLKSLNAAVLRTGGAALRTVTVLVDEVLRPASARPRGLPRRQSELGRSSDHEGRADSRLAAQAHPIVILQGAAHDDGHPATACGRAGHSHARARGGRRRALRPRCADATMALAIAEASLDRLGVATGSTALRRRGAAELVPKGSSPSFGTGSVPGRSRGALPLDRPSATTGRATRIVSRP